MTELVSRAGCSLLVVLGRSPSVALITCLVASLALPMPSLAAPAQGAPEGPTATPTSSSAVAEPAAVRSALEAGDLTAASELAVALSAAEPTADNFALEAEVWLALGDYAEASAALDDAIAALPSDAKDDRAALERLRDETAALARGTKPDEPESTHREQLDRDRADRMAALAPKPELVPEPVDQPKPREPIIKKWYFWVTLGAIVATAGAIVGVAISANTREGSSDAASRQPPPPGGLTIRF